MWLTLCISVVVGLAQEKTSSPVTGFKQAESAEKYRIEVAEARKIIAAANAKWIEGWRKADPDMVASIFAADGIQLRQKGAVVAGRQAILESQRMAMQSTEPGVEVKVDTAQVWIAGGEVYETGSWTYRYIEKGKQLPETETGRYVTVWKWQTDGTLKLSIDMDVPLDSPTP